MAETYCGKTCAECAQKEQLNCPGCRVGPGRTIGGECDLVRCCRTKGHETCDTCGFKGNCGTLRCRDWMPDNRRRKLESAAAEKAAVARRAPILGKWLWIMFWLCIAFEAVGLLSFEQISQLIPAIKIPVTIITAALNIAYCFILLKMSSEEERYRTAGICIIAGWVLTAVSDFFFGGSETGWSLIFTLPAAVVGFVGDYQEFTAHGNVLWDVDNELSDKWGMLWKWYIGCYGAVFGCIILMIIIPVIAVVVMIAAAIAFLVIHIVRLVYLYQTAKIFRELKAA